MKQHWYNLQSKTVLGLVMLLGIGLTLQLMGQLSAEMVEIIKWVGGSYMAVQAVRNHSEGKKGST